jgi:Protein of unknown function (DUF2849)
MPQVLTANRLSDGEVVYLALDGAWVESIEAAQVVADSDADAALATGQQAERDLKIVHAYLLDITPAGRPVKMREIIRAAGPTVRTDLGKQAR